MSEMTLFSQGSNLEMPAHLKGMELDETTKALMGGGGGKRLSIRGSVFRKIVGGEEVAKMEDRMFNVVIAAAAPKIARTYYEGEYSEEVINTPRCWSADGEKPDAAVEDPMSSACATCPMNVSGSGQGDSRACRYSQRLAVLVEGDLEGDVLQLSLPAKSLFGKKEKGGMPLQSYVRFLASHNLPVTAVVTEMKFDTDSATPKLFFKAVRPLSEEEFNTVQEQAASQDAIDAITFTVHQTDKAGEFETSAEEEAVVAQAKTVVKAAAKKAVKKAAAKKAVKKAAPKPAPAAEPEEEDPIAALERQLAEAKAAKEAAKEAAPEVTKREKEVEDVVATEAADIMAEWADSEEFDD